MTKKFTVSYYDIVCMQKDVEVEAENREEALQIANFEAGTIPWEMVYTKEWKKTQVRLSKD